MIIFNEQTIFALAIGLACGFGMYSFNRTGSAAMFVGAISSIVFDLVCRLRNHDQDVPLLAPNAGGHIWFIPIWIIGIVVTGIGGMLWAGWL